MSMHGKHFNKKDLAFIRNNYQGMSNGELGTLLGRTASSISYQLVKMKLQRSGRKIWTASEIKELHRVAPKMSHKQLAEHFNTSVSSAKGALKNHKVKSGRTGYFPKGHRPVNWNVKSPGFSTGRMKETQFQKGGLPANTLHDGAITVRYDHPKTRSGRAYKWIRISKGKWIHYHRYLWEQKYGTVPAKHVVIFKNGDTMDTRMSNLKMITMAENAIRNYNPEKAHRQSKGLTDQYIASRLAPKDKKLQKSIMLQSPELIELKRTQLKLNRTINNERRKQTQEAA